MQKRRNNPLRVVPGGRSTRVVNPIRLGLFSISVTALLAFTAWSFWPTDMTNRPPFGPAWESSASLPFTLGQPDPVLVPRLAALTAQPKLRTGLFVLDLHSGSYVTQDADVAYPAASTIKVPILLALLQDIDRGLVRWDETLPMKVRVSGSGFLQYKPLGTPLRIWELGGLMITDSDNTATELIIERLGGREALNQRFSWWGLKHTALRSQLPDIAGTNTTSPEDLAITLTLLDRGAGLTAWTRDRGLDWLKRVENRSLLPTGLAKVEPTARIAHKTGTIGIALSDAGLVDLPNGKRYLIIGMVERPREDRRAAQLLQNVSTLVAEAWTSPGLKPKVK